MLPIKFQLIWPNGFREDYIIGQSQTRSANGKHENFVETKQFQRKRFLEIDQPETRICLWQPCLLTDRDEMSNLYRRPSRDASYQVSVHLA